MLQPRVAKEILHLATTPQEVLFLPRLSTSNFPNGAILNHVRSDKFFVELYRRWLEEQMKVKTLQEEKIRHEQKDIQQEAEPQKALNQMQKLEADRDMALATSVHEIKLRQEMEKDMAEKDKQIDNESKRYENEKSELSGQIENLMIQVKEANKETT